MFASYGYAQLKKYAFLTVAGIVITLLLGHFISPIFSWLSLIPVLEFLFVLYFFRDPYREVPQEDES